MKVYSIIIILVLSFVNLIGQTQNIDLTPSTGSKTNNHYLAFHSLNIHRGELKGSYEYQIPQSKHSFYISASNIKAQPINIDSQVGKGFAAEFQYRYALNTSTNNANHKTFIGGYGRQTKITQDYTLTETNIVGFNTIPNINLPFPQIEINTESGTRVYNAFDMGFIFGHQWTVLKHLKVELATGIGRTIKRNNTNLDTYQYRILSKEKWANNYRYNINDFKPRFNFAIGYAF